MAAEMSPLWHAVNCSLEDGFSLDRYDRVLALIEEGYDVNEQDEDGQSLLISCCNTNYLFDNQICQLLLQMGARP
jgi:ankyrin repeat protein